MNAGRLLRETGHDTDALRALVTPINPDRVNVWPASALLRRFWLAGIKGVTLCKWVLVDPEVMAGDRDRLARLVIHEMIHLRQFRDQGCVPFLIRYLAEYLSGRLGGKGARQAYLDIGAEREARDVTEEIILHS